jgi:serine/threonine-protein kinase
MFTTDALAAALIDRYRIQRELGRGGMATVYLARDLRHDRQVAIKVLHPELAAVLGAERFLAEIRTTANLQHPHILPLFDSGSADGQLFYVMPFVDGETLRARIERETQLPVADAVRIATEVADALAYAHERGVIHRDIKPENILLHGGHALVADFGIALAVQQAGGQRMTQTGLSLGTPQYMAPEQAMGDKNVDARADIYALGAVCYEMLIGEPPFTGPTPQAIIARVLTSAAAALTASRPTIPPHIEHAVLTALAKLPADRFASANAFAHALANASAAVPQVGRALPRDRALAWRRAFFAMTAVALVAIVTSIAATVAARRHAATSVGVSRFAVALNDSEALAPLPDRGRPRRLAVSPDGERIVYTGPTGRPATSQLWMRSVNELNARPLPHTEGASNPTFSPDGKRLAFIAGTRGVLRVLDLTDGNVVKLTDSLVNDGGLAWGRDGYLYYSLQSIGTGIARVAETGGVSETMSYPDAKREEFFHTRPEPLPNGHSVLITIVTRGNFQARKIGVLDTRTRTHRTLVDGFAAWYVASRHLLYATADGVLMAVPFDPDRLELTGQAVPIATGLARSNDGGVDVAASENGLLVYAAGSQASARRELVWVDRKGTGTSVDAGWTGDLESRVRLSPDGRSALVVRTEAEGRGTVWVKQLDRGAATRLAQADLASVAWSPDGKSIAYTASSETGGELWLGPADGSVAPHLITKTPSRSGQIEFTPDGQSLVYSSVGSLFSVRARGDSPPTTLLEGPGRINNPVVSPDGHWLAYSSRESGEYQVYVRPFPETRGGKQPISTRGGTLPRWSRDGKELFFVEVGTLIAVPVESNGRTLRVGEAKRLFGLGPFIQGVIPPAFDVSADGQRFLMTRAVGTGVPTHDEMIVVQGFFEELRAKAGGRR